MDERILVFSTANYDYMAEAFCEDDQFTRGSLQRQRFPDCENYQRLTAAVKGRDAVVIGGTIDEVEILELYDLASGLVHYGVDTLTLVVPYFGGSTMERAARAGDIVTAKTRAVLLSSIPQARICNEILTVELHTPGINHYFEGHLRSYHLMAKRLIGRIIRNMEGFPDLVLASTDAGRAKWVEGLANDLQIPAAFAYKRRLENGTTEICGINADVSGRNVVIYDDMIRTGGTLFRAAEAYRKAGAAGLTAITTHGVLPDDALERLRSSGLLDKLIATDTHPRGRRLAAQSNDRFLEIHSMVPEIVRFLLSRDALGD